MKKIFSLAVSAMLLVACGKNQETVKSDNPALETGKQVSSSSHNLNVSILLDLSDRINPEKYPNPAMEFYERDAAYISSVASGFLDHVKSKKLILLNDGMKLFFNPDPSSKEINDISNSLKVHFTKNTPQTEIERTKSVYASEPLKIYQSAIRDGQYVGSDIWGFFREKVKDYSIKDGQRNVIVILTDGYMYHAQGKRTEKNLTTFLTPEFIRTANLNTSEWKAKMETEDYGFLKAAEGLMDVEVLVLGINPDLKNPYESEVIKEYWSKWFREMGIQKFEIHGADLPSNLDPVIRKFINN